MILIDAQNTAEFETEFVLCIGRYDLYLKIRWKVQISFESATIFESLKNLIKYPTRNCEFDVFILDRPLIDLVYALL